MLIKIIYNTIIKIINYRKKKKINTINVYSYMLIRQSK